MRMCMKEDTPSPTNIKGDNYVCGQVTIVCDLIHSSSYSRHLTVLSCF